MPIWRRSGPDVLNSWKIEVMAELYRRAMRRLSDGGRKDSRCRADGALQVVWKVLKPAEQSDPWFERQLAALPEAFVSRQSPEAVADTLRRLRGLQARPELRGPTICPRPI